MAVSLPDLRDRCNAAHQEARGHTRESFSQRILQDEALVLCVELKDTALTLNYQIHEGHNQPPFMLREKFVVSSRNVVRTPSKPCRKHKRPNGKIVKDLTSVKRGTIYVDLRFGDRLGDDILKAQVKVSGGFVTLQLSKSEANSLRTYNDFDF